MAVSESHHNVKLIQSVENDFHEHVSRSFTHLEQAVNDIAVQVALLESASHDATRTTKPAAGHDARQAPPLGISSSDVQHEASESHGCEVRDGHCHHVEPLMKDMSELKKKEKSKP